MAFKIGVLISDNLTEDHEDTREDVFELEEQMAKIIPAFKAQGMIVDTVRWRDAASLADEYDAFLPLFVWDYFENNQDLFLSEMAKVSQKTKLFNEFDVLKWNSDKSYLEDLEKSGAPVIRTLYVNAATESSVHNAMETLNAEKVVIKPVIGGGAWRQSLYHKDDVFPDRESLPPQSAMIQAFLPSVQSEGEYSFIYFGGQFSHAVLKRAKSGDYRIQSVFGGTEETYTPSSAERANAREILDALDFIPLYARVDLLRGNDGQLKLIELELLEPYLYLAHAPGDGAENKGAQKLASAVLKRLGN